MHRTWFTTLLACAALAFAFVATVDAADPPAKKKILLLAGGPSHGFGAHDHLAGCRLLAHSLETAMGYKCDVIYKDWPKDAAGYEGYDCVVMYSDGGGGHPANSRLAAIDAAAKKGMGVVCVHYAVETVKGEPGAKFLDWIGGYFETHWSVNPHWTASFEKFPDHPICRGVKPFKADDEWYYHMRFREGMKGVTPILTAMPPESTLNRGDGPHSGNPDVREAVLKRKEAQHVAWAAEREGGGRGFGFTGAHNHWNWGNEDFRKVVLNAIVWCAHGEVPQSGVGDPVVTVEKLLENPDENVPANFDAAGTAKRFNIKTNADIGKKPEPKKESEKKEGAATPGKSKALFSSPVITTKTPGHAVDVDVDITGAKQLFLVVTDGGNGYGCDWSDWAEPRLVGPNGEKKLTELKWKSAGADWGNVHVNKNAGGDPLKIAGKSVEYGIGVHANSVVAFDLPEGYTRFKARGGIDNGGSDQQGGNASSVQFHVYTTQPPAFVAAPAAAGGGNAASHDPDNAVAGLDVADGLEATLVAAEPTLLSLTNLDIDHRGRIWVCEVVNYRGNNGKRPEGDRILILEDKDGDGKADETKVFYQGRDIDSAMGICVLGKKIIVSASPNIIVFTDENGDDKPDSKEMLFTKTGQPQHDHSAHSFLFGPDGKYYWNFGNTGQRVCDKDGKPVVDLAGHVVQDNGKPYWGGMPFRCNPDGSGFEVLGHNFRNNYEVTVDSYGTVWQSDNDDDGNKGVRINYVMEFGNFGYRDEFTGAGWQSPRTNMEKEKPLQHWHLNDPGVVPNLVQTGAGSPTGICVYEGRLLPKIFWDQVIHCDAGPNVVRAYVAKKDGAGYQAEMVNILFGARDNWFRPADVCTAPDGSLFVTDWYDPGVGGHGQRDLERGRLFRIAPPGAKYTTPKFDFDTVEGCIKALENPCLSVRYMAFEGLMKQPGETALDKLQGAFGKAENPRFKARIAWVAAKILSKAKPDDVIEVVEDLMKSENPDLRIVAIRISRQEAVTNEKYELARVLKKLAADPDPAVRREVAIALRGSKLPEAPAIWAELAAAHDGKDRWYLEALGIAAEGQWDSYLDAYLKKVGDGWNNAVGRDILWRSRAKATPGYLAKIVTDPKTTAEEKPRYMRAFDFLKGPEKDAALKEILGL